MRTGVRVSAHAWWPRASTGRQEAGATARAYQSVTPAARAAASAPNRPRSNRSVTTGSRITASPTAAGSDTASTRRSARAAAVPNPARSPAAPRRARPGNATVATATAMSPMGSSMSWWP